MTDALVTFGVGVLAVVIAALPIIHVWAKMRHEEDVILLEADMRRRGIGVLHRYRDPDGSVYYKGSVYSRNLWESDASDSHSSGGVSTWT